MEPLFLGTCACDYSKKLEAEYKNAFDFDARRSSCVLLDNRYLIDCGEHTLQALRIATVDYSAITDIFITHLHSDHYNVKHIAEIAKGKKEKMKVWCREDANIPQIDNVEVIKMAKTKKYEICAGFTVTGLLANHDEKAYLQHLLFERETNLFYMRVTGLGFLTKRIIS